MSTDTQKIIDESFQYLMKTYSPQPVVMDHGKGAYAYDTSGKKYLDFAAGIAVASLGHAHPAVLKTINEQAARMITCQASYATKEKLHAAELLVKTSCFDLVYFSNSGTESVEAALKCARKWAYEEKGEECNEIIAFHNSFHGRTYGSASVTEKRHVQPFFGPYLPGVHFATFNDLDSVKALVSDKTAAIIIEPVQGEGGLTPAHPSFLRSLRALCDEHNICLIFDEVQTGFGRLGTLHAYQAFACCPDCQHGEPNPANHQIIEPDIACWAKGMGSGFPVGAMAAKKKFGEAITVGTHGTTYGGNPLACAVAATVIEEMLKDGFMEHVHAVSNILFKGLNDIRRSSNKITDIRGKGLMLGVDTVFDIKKLLGALQSNGLMATQAGKATLRLTPPLILSEGEAKEALAVIEKTLSEMDE
ncbi:MAG: acetylornithine/succinylornithine family transaminase [Rhodospirillales bacterium]|nr:acetylornithine/succinylornithine family transaminase [Rhodospirillales bacterium]